MGGDSEVCLWTVLFCSKQTFRIIQLTSAFLKLGEASLEKQPWVHLWEHVFHVINSFTNCVPKMGAYEKRDFWCSREGKYSDFTAF